MASINHSIGLKAGKEEILSALNTVTGLSKWWTNDVRGNCQEGSTIEFRFDGSGPDMKVIASTSDKIMWECISGPKEWLGTTIEFELIDNEHEILLHFQHNGWADITPFHHHCSMKWAVFMLSLKDYLEKGRGHAFPNDIQITH